jgi:hypothetical protein
MEIPTKQDRIRNLYGVQIDELSVILNKAILEVAETTDGKGYRYIEARSNSDSDYVNSNIIQYLDDHYRKAGWIIEQHTDSDDEHKHHIRIYYLANFQPPVMDD